MEIIFEFLYMLFIDGSFEIISNQKINIVFRSIVLGIITNIYLGFIFAFTMLIIKIQSIIIKLLFALVILLILSMLIKLWLKLYKNKAI